MIYNFSDLPSQDRYRLLSNFVAPRPVALITTRDADGRPNAAPMSFFNVFSHDPAIVALGIQDRPDGRTKDTMANLRATGEFTAHMVDLPMAEAMLICGLDLPPEIDELAVAGLASRSGEKTNAPVIETAPVAMECRVERMIEWPERAIILGEVVAMHIRPDCFAPGGRYANPETFQPIARLHADNYIVADRQFELVAPDRDAVLKAALAQIC